MVVKCGVLTEHSTPAEINLYYLEDAVRSLAQPPELQQHGEEMVVDFDAWYVPAVSDGYLADLRPDQCQALEKIDRLLSEMTALQEPEPWTTSEALATSSWWAVVREAARDALRILQWSPDPPESVWNKTIVGVESQE